MSVGLGLPGDILAVSLGFLCYDSQEDIIHVLCPRHHCFPSPYYRFSLLS